jgi:hypothetical protein
MDVPQTGHLKMDLTHKLPGIRKRKARPPNTIEYD